MVHQSGKRVGTSVPELCSSMARAVGERLGRLFLRRIVFYVSRHIRGWLQPMVWWTIFLTVLAFVMLCTNTIIRKQWIERERLTYSLIDLPFEMTRKRF